MKKRQSKEHHGPLLMLLATLAGGLYAGWQTGHHHNWIVVFSVVGLITLILTKLLSVLFRKLPRIFKPLYLVTQASILCSFFIVLFYLLK